MLPVLLGVSLNMPLSGGHMRDTLHWHPVQQRISYRVDALVLHCLLGIAPVGLWAYLDNAFEAGWPSIASFSLRWQALGPSGKLSNHATPSILSRRSFNLEFTSLIDSIPTKDKHAIALKVVQN